MLLSTWPTLEINLLLPASPIIITSPGANPVLGTSNVVLLPVTSTVFAVSVTVPLSCVKSSLLCPNLFAYWKWLSIPVLAELLSPVGTGLPSCVVVSSMWKTTGCNKSVRVVPLDKLPS